MVEGWRECKFCELGATHEMSTGVNFGTNALTDLDGFDGLDEPLLLQ
jgi:hypothetical protein